MARAIVLGGGLVGSVMAADMAADGDVDVALADVRVDRLAEIASRTEQITGRMIETIKADLSDVDTLKRVIAPFDIVLGALASPIGFQSLRAVIEAGKPFSDICFMPENAIELHDLATQHGVTAVVDCGVAPGMSNMMAGHAVATLDRCDRIEIYVGGLPRGRHWPFEYKAGFSPYDVIEEYTRPARIVEHGEVVTREALSEPELMDFPGIGTLEAFNTDGLRSLIDTLDVPDMIEKTLRYPGHIELMRVLRHMELFSHEPVAVAGQQVRPIDVTTALMFPKWQYDPGEADLTVMRVIAHGERAGSEKTLQWDLLDRLDPETDWTSMSRTTGFPATIVAQMILAGQINQPGVLPPERLGAIPGVLEHVLGELEARGVRYQAR